LLPPREGFTQAVDHELGRDGGKDQFHHPMLIPVLRSTHATSAADA